MSLSDKEEKWHIQNIFHLFTNKHLSITLFTMSFDIQDFKVLKTVKSKKYFYSLALLLIFMSFL